MDEILKYFRTKNNELTADQFIIKDNLLKVADITLQLSNISQIYAGKRKIKIPFKVVITFLVSLVFLFMRGNDYSSYAYSDSSGFFRFLNFIGLLGCVVTGLYFFIIYQNYISSKYYLSFSLNSGKTYILPYKESRFLEDTRLIVEKAFETKHANYTVNIAEQKIIEGDEHILENKGGFVNFGVQEDHSSTIYNQDSFNQHEETVDSSVNFGDISDSTIQSDIIGNNNSLKKEEADMYDWKELAKELQEVISSIKIDTPVKEASQEALLAVQEQDSKKFEKIVKSRKTEFLSELFLNTASGVLAQAISFILKIS